MQLNNFNFENTSVIKPPSDEDKKKFNNCSNKESTFIIIDSRDRDLLLYPNTNQFTIDLEEPIREVNEIELISANMPINFYNINDNNNRIYFIRTQTTNDNKPKYDYSNSNDYPIYSKDAVNKYNPITKKNDILQYYNYTLQKDNIYYIKIQPNLYRDFIALKTYINATDFILYNYNNNEPVKNILDNQIIVKVYMSYNNYKINLRINSNGETSSINDLIHFRGNSYNLMGKTIYEYLPKSAHEILGFDLNYSYTNNTLNNLSQGQDALNFNNEIATNYSLQLDNDAPNINISNTHANLNANEYVLLHLTNFPKFTNKISTSNTVKDAYAKLHLGNSNTRNIFFGRIKAFTNVYNLNPPIKLNKIELKFTDYYGNLFNFNNSNFTLTFCITYNKQPSFYNY